MEIKFDQHFLINEDILKTSINYAKINKEDIILEIGPGKGILSMEILKKNPKKLISIEIDEKLKDDLEKILEKNHNFELKFGNAIELMENIYFNKIISNIPYCITENLFRKILEKKPNICILLISKKSYNLIQNKKSKWYYFLNANYEIKLIEEISGDSFYPKTKVKSALISMNLNEKKDNYNIFLKNLFEKEKRTTKNAILYSLIDTLKKSKKEIISEFSKENVFFPNKTIENLSNAEFIKIISKIEKIINS